MYGLTSVSTGDWNLTYVSPNGTSEWVNARSGLTLISRFNTNSNNLAAAAKVSLINKLASICTTASSDRSMGLMHDETSPVNDPIKVRPRKLSAIPVDLLALLEELAKSDVEKS
jgi:hypothetical protein